MQDNHMQGGGGPIQKAHQAAHIVLFVARVLATPLEIGLRNGFGPRYFGFQALVAVIVVPLWMALWPGHSPALLNGFWILMLLMFLRARIQSMRMVAKGDIVHTRFNGTPILGRYFKRMSEAKIKAMCEPGFGLLAGGLISQVDKPLGSLLIASAFALFIVQATMQSAEHARASELNDALIEQQSLSERFRAMQRDRMR